MIYSDNVHLVADSLPELHAFAEKIGLHRCYFEGVRKRHPHYDLLNIKKQLLKDKQGKIFRDKVIECGAQLISDKKLLVISKGLVKQPAPTLF